jgi:hypothetical protein
MSEADHSYRPEPLAELWAFGSPRGRWLGNTDEGYVGAFPVRLDAEAIKGNLDEPDATGPHLVGVDPRWRDVALELLSAAENALHVLTPARPKMDGLDRTRMWLREAIDKAKVLARPTRRAARGR